MGRGQGGRGRMNRRESRGREENVLGNALGVGEGEVVNEMLGMLMRESGETSTGFRNVRKARCGF